MNAPAAPPQDPQGAATNSNFSNLDFFAEPSVVLANLTPDKNGVVKFSRELLKGRQYLQILVLDPESTLMHTLTLPEDKIGVLDLRLAKGLDPKSHFTQQKQTTYVDSGAKLNLPDVSGSRFEVYDSLGKVYSLFATLSHNSTLVEFSFITRWPKLMKEEKQTFYSKYACHELNFFIAKKDPAFFNEAVKPYLANKKNNTFLDRWLIEEDVATSLQPWPYERLNIVERILLGQRIKPERPYALRHVQDLFALLPPDMDRRNHLFGTAVLGSGLETTGLGVDVLAAGENKPMERAMGFALGDRPMSKAAAAPAAAAPGKPADEKQRFSGAKKSQEEAAGRQLRMRNENAKMDSLKELADKDAKDYSNRDGVELEFRKRVEQLFRQVEKTQEYAENNYYHLLIERHVADLVSVNSFWRDYAVSDPEQPFRSPNFPEASRNFTEMMFALSVLDLPFEAKPHDTKFEGTALQFTAASPAIVFHEEIKTTGEKKNDSPILVSQNFFQANDRHRIVENETVDKFVTEEFMVHTVYGCQVVVTNPTSSRQRLEALLQIPVGALPVSNGQATKSISLDLQPFGTQTVEYFFYFPRAGKFAHYPIHISKNAALVAFAEPMLLNVVEEPTRIDRESWEFVSQQGTNDQVLEYLKTQNLYRVNLDRIAFRMADAKFFEQASTILTARHHYNHTLWAYAVKHGKTGQIADYLQHCDPFVNESGIELTSGILKINPVARFTYQHLEYMPLVNARAHQLGQRRQIVNDRFHGQYHQLLAVLSRHRTLSHDDLLAVTYYLLLQDRVEEATATFARVNAAAVATRLQYDYCAAYLDMFQDEPKLAPVLANKYAKYPVDRWRNAFAAVSSQLEEISGAKGRVIDPENREQRQAELAAKEAVFDFRVEGRNIVLNHRNLENVTINYYVMDIEFLFSRNPFVQEFSGEFGLIRPNLTKLQKLDPQVPATKLALPEAFADSNVLVEIVGGGQTKAQAAYAHSLSVQLAENYGEVRVDLLTSGKPLPKTYVKAYAQMRDGSVKFYKDGYTDLRGKFDYTSLSTNELDNVQKFSLLIMNDEHGAVIREAMPPKDRQHLKITKIGIDHEGHEENEGR